ncbi:MAG TPA: ion channel [Patescibacteria group bacterium]|nr:ion channel [Patescibacteria group bacterium]
MTNSMTDQSPTPPKVDEWATGSSTYQLFNLGMSFYAVLGWIAIFLLPISDDARNILLGADKVVSLFFLYDFFRRLFSVDRKKDYLKWGWLDLLSSFPWFPLLRIIRVSYIIRVRRYLQATSGLKILDTFRQKRAETALLGTLFALFLLLIFGSILVLDFEVDAPGADIVNSEDALYWSIVTLTTVGYGDLAPVTEPGRLVAVVIMTSGVALVGVLSGYLVSYFTPETEDPKERLAQIEKDLSEIKQLLNEYRPQQTNPEIEEPDAK